MPVSFGRQVSFAHLCTLFLLGSNEREDCFRESHPRSRPLQGQLPLLCPEQRTPLRWQPQILRLGEWQVGSRSGRPGPDVRRVDESNSLFLTKPKQVGGHR